MDGAPRPAGASLQEESLSRLRQSVIQLREEVDTLKTVNASLVEEALKHRTAAEQAVSKQQSAERKLLQLQREMTALYNSLAPDDPDSESSGKSEGSESNSVAPSASVDLKRRGHSRQMSCPSGLPVVPQVPTPTHSSTSIDIPQPPSPISFPSRTPDGYYAPAAERLSTLTADSTPSAEVIPESVFLQRRWSDEWHETDVPDRIAGLTEVEILRKKLAQQRRKTAFLETSKAQVVNELEELTQTLFEESNKLVRDEAIQRWQSQQTNLKLERQLEMVRQQLKFETAQRKALEATLRKTADQIRSSQVKRRSNSVTREKTGSQSARTKPSPLERQVTSPRLRTRQFMSSIDIIDFEASSKSRHHSSTVHGHQAAIEVLHHFGDKRESESTSKSDTESSDEVDVTDPAVMREFGDFIAQRKSLTEGVFAERLLKEDFEPLLENCVSRRLRAKVWETAANGECFIQPISAACAERGKCCVCGAKAPTDFMLRTGTTSDWQALDLHCRHKVVAICDLFNVLRHIRARILKGTPQQLFIHVAKARLCLQAARIGCANLMR